MDRKNLGLGTDAGSAVYLFWRSDQPGRHWVITDQAVNQGWNERPQKRTPLTYSQLRDSSWPRGRTAFHAILPPIILKSYQSKLKFYHQFKLFTQNNLHYRCQANRSDPFWYLYFLKQLFSLPNPILLGNHDYFDPYLWFLFAWHSRQKLGQCLTEDGNVNRLPHPLHVLVIVSTGLNLALHSWQ